MKRRSPAAKQRERIKKELANASETSDVDLAMGTGTCVIWDIVEDTVVARVKSAGTRRCRRCAAPATNTKDYGSRDDVLTDGCLHADASSFICYAGNLFH